MARIQPPFPRVRLVSGSPQTREGDLQEFELSFGPLRRSWAARITRVVKDRGFEDVQVEGPFRRWRHQHLIIADGEGSRLSDRIDFELAGRWLDGTVVRAALGAMLRWRHWRTRQLLRRARIR